MAKAPVIEMVDIVKTYASSVPVRALRGVSLTIGPGEFVALMGPSGSGKSTLMNVIGCLDRPSEGIYRLSGQDVAQMTDNHLAGIRNRRIGFVFQAYNLVGTLTALENVELPLVYRGMDGITRRRLARNRLQEVGLDNRLHHLPLELSGGQQQRVAIARALVGQPDLLLADEPTGNLDSEAGQDILALFRDLNQAGRTIVLITHDEAVAGHAQTLYRLQDGLIIGVQYRKDAHADD